jgi:hypothetical protein
VKTFQASTKKQRKFNLGDLGASFSQDLALKPPIFSAKMFHVKQYGYLRSHTQSFPYDRHTPGVSSLPRAENQGGMETLWVRGRYFRGITSAAHPI